MHDLTQLGPRIVIRFSDNFYITETTIFAIIFAIVLTIILLFLGNNLKKIPGKKQVLAEFIVKTFYNLTTSTMGKNNASYAPYIGTLILWVGFSNMAGLFGFRPPTSDLNMVFALSSVTFFLIQYGAISTGGVKHYLSHFAKPMPFMVPIKIIEEVSFPISLAMRLFGNILGGYIVVALLMNLLDYVSEVMLKLPIPILAAVLPLPANALFDIFEPILQAFIFTLLTMAFIGKSLVVRDTDIVEN